MRGWYPSYPGLSSHWLHSVNDSLRRVARGLHGQRVSYRRKRLAALGLLRAVFQSVGASVYLEAALDEMAAVAGISSIGPMKTRERLLLARRSQSAAFIVTPRCGQRALVVLNRRVVGNHCNSSRL